MKKLKLSLAALCAGLLCAAAPVHAASIKAINEAPEVHGIIKHDPSYHALHEILELAAPQLQTLLDAVVNEATYETLYNYVNTLKLQAGVTGRIVITLPDGTVVVDTSKPTDFTDINANYANSYTHFQDKNVNENHNSRLAILNANFWPYPWGLEIKFSTSDDNTQQYVATRLGEYLNSSGVARISIVISSPI